VISCTPAEQKHVQIQDVDAESLRREIQSSQRPYVLINFFRMDCAPCAIELMELAQLHADPESQVAVKLISFDAPEVAHSDLASYFQQLGIQITVYHFDPSEALPFLAQQAPHWDQTPPLNLIFAQPDRLVESTGLTNRKEVQLIVHADQSFPRTALQP